MKTRIDNVIFDIFLLIALAIASMWMNSIVQISAGVFDYHVDVSDAFLLIVLLTVLVFLPITKLIKYYIQFITDRCVEHKILYVKWLVIISILNTAIFGINYLNTRDTSTVLSISLIPLIYWIVQHIKCKKQLKLEMVQKIKELQRKLENT